MLSSFAFGALSLRRCLVLGALCLPAVPAFAAQPADPPYGIEIIPRLTSAPQTAALRTLHREQAEVDELALSEISIRPAASMLLAEQKPAKKVKPVKQETKTAEESPAPPAASGDTVTIEPQPLCDPQTILTRAANYAEVYKSIPFSRAEYEASPSYRHDATMEILFGQLRPTVIHRTQAPVVRSHWSQDLYRPRRNWYTASPYRVFRGYYGLSYQYAYRGGWGYRVR